LLLSEVLEGFVQVVQVLENLSKDRLVREVLFSSEVKKNRDHGGVEGVGVVVKEFLQLGKLGLELVDLDEGSGGSVHELVSDDVSEDLDDGELFIGLSGVDSVVEEEFASLLF